jgi:SAM-dependent methyltransferase
VSCNTSTPIKNKMIKILKRFYNKMTGRQIVIELRKDIAAMQAQVADARNDITGVQQEITDLRKSYLTLRYHACFRPDESLPIAAKFNEVPPISEQLDLLQQLAPHAYAVWRPLLEVNEGAYEGLPIDSCSVAGHPMATFFRFFLTPYLKGRVLDIGCGPQPVPIYLEEYSVGLIYGVDPLSSPEKHPFNFIKGLAEYLPWANDQFKLAISATSLDHVLLLDKVFEEICRVLTRDGIFAVWEGFIPGSKPYDPYCNYIEKVDDYHLFHFDRNTFMDAIEPYFSVFEEFTMDAGHSFFALRPRNP